METAVTGKKGVAGETGQSELSASHVWLKRKRLQWLLAESKWGWYFHLLFVCIGKIQRSMISKQVHERRICLDSSLFERYVWNALTVPISFVRWNSICFCVIVITCKEFAEKQVSQKKRLIRSQQWWSMIRYNFENSDQIHCRVSAIFSLHKTFVAYEWIVPFSMHSDFAASIA